MGELVLGAFVLSVTSLAETVALPKLVNVILNEAVPLVRDLLTGVAVPPAEQAMLTTSVTVLTRLKVASTAFTVTVNATPAVWLTGAPLFPVAVPGAKVSPGTITSRLLNPPPLTEKSVLRALLKPTELAVNCLLGPAASISKLV